MMNVNHVDDQDPAADLTRRIGAAFTWVAIVAFPVGTVVCVAILLVGDVADPKPTAWTATLGALASLAAFSRVRRRR